MRAVLAILMLVATTPIADAADRYSGRYSTACGTLVCELAIAPIRGGWTVRWSASDPRVLDAEPICGFETTAELGSARMGPAGVVEGIAVGRVKGQPFGLFDLGDGRVSWSSSWAACGIAPKGIYSAFGDE